MIDVQNLRLEKMLAHYREDYEVSYNRKLASVELMAMAERHDRKDRAILGFKISGKMPEANEYVFFYEEPVFDAAALERLSNMVAAAEKELVKPDKDHAFSFLSAVVFCGEAEAEALKGFRRYKMRRNYGGNGWVITRTALVPANGEIVAGKDGGDFKNLLERVLNENMGC